MSISSEEQRALAEIERYLELEDPGFADRVQGLRRRRRGLFVAWALGFGCGLVLVGIGLLGTDGIHVLLSVAGFVVLVASWFALLADFRRGRRRPYPGG